MVRQFRAKLVVCPPETLRMEQVAFPLRALCGNQRPKSGNEGTGTDSASAGLGGGGVSGMPASGMVDPTSKGLFPSRTFPGRESLLAWPPEFSPLGGNIGSVTCGSGVGSGVVDGCWLQPVNSVAAAKASATFVNRRRISFPPIQRIGAAAHSSNGGSLLANNAYSAISSRCC